MKEDMELYRKYRPNTFEDILGNDLSIRAVQKELEHGSHVFLFTGSAGTGKTTLARVFANYLNAGPLSIREINSAENRGIDSAREIMEVMRYNPSDGDAMVWILDEFHQQTKAAQEAFLKPMEETPSHVYFFICTTNPEKIIPALKTRCSIVTLKPLGEETMRELLENVCKKENQKVSEDVIDQIIVLAEGGSRQALKLLGKVLFCETDKERIRILRGISAGDTAKETIDFCRALYSKKADYESIMKLFTKMDLTEPEKVRYAVLGYGNAIMMKRFDPWVLKVMNEFSSNTFDCGKFALTIMIGCLFSE